MADSLLSSGADRPFPCAAEVVGAVAEKRVFKVFSQDRVQQRVEARPPGIAKHSASTESGLVACRSTQSGTTGTYSRVNAQWMPRDRGKRQEQLVEVPKIAFQDETTQRTFDQFSDFSSWL